MIRLRKQQLEVKCPDCGKLCKTGGLVNHIRLKHLKVYEKIQTATSGILVDDELLKSVSEKVGEQILEVVLKNKSDNYSSIFENYRDNVNRYYNAIIYYKDRPELAKIEWEKWKDNWMIWNINEDKMIALRRLCEPNKNDLDILPSGYSSYWDLPKSI